MKRLHALLLSIAILLAAIAVITSITVSSQKSPPLNINEGQKQGAIEEGQTEPSGTQGLTEEGRPDHPVIYVSFVSHNEDKFSPNYPDFPQDEEAFWDFRSRVVTYANMLYEMGATYNYQSDWTFLLGMKAFDKGISDTNGKNLLRYLEEDLGFSIDPHSHEQGGYNYADVAYLMELLGANPTGIVGGFTAINPKADQPANWETFWDPIEAETFDYTWVPTILWGGASPGHRNESEVWVSGIWRPSGQDAFLEHDENSPLPNVGGFETNWDGLALQVERLQNGELSADQMYTQTIMLGEHEMTDERIEEYRANIASYDKLVEDGYIQWVTLQEAVDIWETQYDSYGGITLYDGTHISP